MHTVGLFGVRTPQLYIVAKFSMKLKITIVLLLLFVLSIYFLCPVICSALGIKACSASMTAQPEVRKVASVSQLSETHADDRHERCCSDHLEILTARVYPRFSTTLDNPPPLVAVITSHAELPPFSAYSTVVRNRHPDSTSNTSASHISPRAPPFPLT